jgi:hypothetical protein
MEILDVVDETGAPTGETVERTEAHRECAASYITCLDCPQQERTDSAFAAEEMYAERFISGLL